METSTSLGTFLATIHQWLECARTEEVSALARLVNEERERRARAAHAHHPGRYDHAPPVGVVSPAWR
jgi:hypothetical protein